MKNGLESSHTRDAECTVTVLDADLVAEVFVTYLAKSEQEHWWSVDGFTPPTLTGQATRQGRILLQIN